VSNQIPLKPIIITSLSHYIFIIVEPIQALRKTITRTLRNFDSAGEDHQQTNLSSDEAGEDGNFDPPARERPAVR
jgi:hypothetical protein